MIKQFLKILPSNLIKEMYNLLSILLHLNIHKCYFAFMTSFLTASFWIHTYFYGLETHLRDIFRIFVY